MKSQNPIRRRGSERGMTLIEVLVAILVFTVVFLAALGLYQAANRAYLQTDAATIQQQNARYAIDRMSETLRDAGANYNSMGRSALADEQIEGAWESAILVRGDFNSRREDGTNSTVDRQSTQWPMVTTGNNEIVGYVLRKTTGNNINLTVKLDVTPAIRDAEKDGGGNYTDEETRTIAVAASNLDEQRDPPYQLTRVTFDNSGNVVYQVIAENVFRLSFIYRNAAGTEAITAASNSGAADAQRTARATVRRIGLNLVTMADRADMGYTDANNYTTDAFGHTAPSQGALTRNRRKFNLSEEIVAVNLGKRGYRHNSAPNVNINAPAWIKVCTGHCKSFLIQWAATTTPGIATYKLRIQATSPFFEAYIPVPTTQYYFTQSEPTIQEYRFSVAGMTTTGIVGAYSAIVPKTATHETTPSVPNVPENVQGSGAAGANAMAVTWNQVTTNTGTITASTCTQAGTSPGVSAPPSTWNNEAVDLAYYEVYRGMFQPGYASGVADGDFTSTAARRVDNAPAVGDLVNTTPRTNTFTDRTAAPCGRYFYRVRAVDGCGLVVAGNGSVAMGQAAKFIPATGVLPAVPAPPTPAAPPVPVAGNYNVTFTWPEVVRDSNGRPARTAHYQLVRQRKIGSGSWEGYPTWATGTPISVWETTTASDSQPAMSGTTPIAYRYAVKAIYPCNDVGDSIRERTGDWYEITCQPPTGNTITSVVPPNNSSVSRPTETGFTPSMNVTGTSWTGATLTIRQPDGTVFRTDTGTPVGSPATAYTFPAFDATTAALGNWTFTFIGEAGTCRSTPVVATVTIENASCGVSVASAAWENTSGSNAFEALNFSLKNDCDFSSITLNGLSVAWDGVTAATRHVTFVEYNNTTYSNTLDATSGAEGTMIVFSGTNSVTLTGGQTSNTITINFNDNMTLSGAHNNNDPGRFDSIIIKLTAPSASNDESIGASPLTPPFP